MSTGLRPVIRPSPIHRRSRPAQLFKAATGLAALTMACWLTGCASGPDRREDDGPARRAAEMAYRPAQRSETVSVEENWIIEGHGVDVLIERPTLAGPLPVVVYLPGLGETRSAGNQWRQAWARAGYAVMSVQPLDTDASAWQSDLARNGEFRELGRRHYAASMMSQRLHALQGVIDEARRRQSASPGTRQLNWNSVVLAGYDLGAYAAMAAAGERVASNGSPVEWASPAALRAVVAISPYADATGPARNAATDSSRDVDLRYRDVHVPVLTVTSDADGDPLGLLADPAQRLIPFEHLDARPGWLLSMRGMPHVALAGNAAYEVARSNAAQAERDRSTMDSQQRQRGNGRRGGGPNNMGEDGFGPGGSSSRARPVPGSGQDAPALSRLGLQWRVDAIGDVSTAFLDAVVRDDPRAKAWLTGDASVRLSDVGSLRSR